MSNVTADPALVALVRTAQEFDFPVVLTLLTAGGIVTGSLIGRDEWVGKFFERSDSGEGSEPVLESLRQAFAAEDSAGGPDVPIEYAFVHLEDIRYRISEARQPTRGSLEALWRGRIDQVVGWTVGHPSPPSEPVIDIIVS